MHLVKLIVVLNGIVLIIVIQILDQVDLDGLAPKKHMVSLQLNRNKLLASLVKMTTLTILDSDEQ